MARAVTRNAAAGVDQIAPAQKQARQPHADGNGPNPGCRQFGAQARDLRGLKHQDEGAAIVDDHGNQSRDDGMGQIVQTDG